MSNTPQGDSKADTAEAKILAILDEMDFKLTGTPKHWEKTPERIAIENEAVQQLKGLLVDARIDELTNFNLPEYDHTKCIDKMTCIGYESAQSDFDNEKELRLAALQQTSRGKEDV